jgi:RNA exonuclease 1
MLMTLKTQFIHPWVIDTSLIYQHPRGPPYKPSLKWLAQKWLSKEIQVPHPLVDGEVVGGHDSEEDARTALELLHIKMEKGECFSLHSCFWASGCA